VVIGCGAPELIEGYRQHTGCPFPIYADPTRKLFDVLGMTQSLNLGSKQPAYQTKSMLASTLASLLQGIKLGSGSFKAGSFRQLGGEFLYEQDAVQWCHRMRNTRDHAEVQEFRTILGLPEEAMNGSGMTSTERLANPAAAKRRSLIVGRMVTGVGRAVQVQIQDWTAMAPRRMEC
jgi:hypothetical protein